MTWWMQSGLCGFVGGLVGWALAQTISVWWRGRKVDEGIKDVLDRSEPLKHSVPYRTGEPRRVK